jgi:hypothetical protein
MDAWYGVDLDGTLAEYDKKDFPQIGEPIAPMIERVKKWIEEGKDVRIFTARIANKEGMKWWETAIPIMTWCAIHIGYILPITAQKDFGMIECWDDRAVQVETNTGKVLGKSSEEDEG